jgi:prepilin-type N-terminal cleavage/methylation domain-containing protein
MLFATSKSCDLPKWSNRAEIGPRFSLSPRERAGARGNRSSSAFTLIELMIVVGIIAIVLTMAVPNIYRYLHPSPIQKSLDAVLDACRDAREAAVLGGATTALIINLKTKSLSIGAASTPPSESAPLSEFPELNPRPQPVQPRTSGKNYQISDRVMIEGLGINGLDYTEDEQAEIRFYAKGTSDEFKVVLHSDQNDMRMVFLDPVTGHADYEVDPQKFERHR